MQIERDEREKCIGSLIQDANNIGIKYNEVKTLKKNLTENQIVNRLGREDPTKGGSCTSQALAYVANKFGYDVSDYRGGKSRSFFNKVPNIDQFTKSGGFKVSNTNDFKNAADLLKYVEKGNEYLFTNGGHTAIIRLKENDSQSEKIFEFLELQASTKKENGFHELTKEILEERFHAKRRRRKESFDFLIDIKKLKSSHKFRELIGFLNTRI